MQLLVPDILTEARGLSDAMCGTLGALGLTLWLFGWRWHRFWIVAGITLAAGVWGLQAGQEVGTARVLAVGLLLAVSAGMLALEMARIFAFLVGGCAAWLAAQWIFPQAQELWAVFLSGGIVGLLLYRLGTMLVTSLIGVWLLAHAGLVLLERLFGLDAPAWAAHHPVLGNGLVVGVTVTGVILQALLSPDGDNPSLENGHSSRPAPNGREGADEPPPKDRRENAPDRGRRSCWWRRLLDPRSVR